jgi:hypothetical protein
VGAGAPALELGSLVHKALAEWILNPSRRLDEIFAQFANERMDEINELCIARTGRSATDEDQASIIDTFQTGIFMMKSYQEYHKHPIPKNFEWAAAEQSVQVSVPGTEHRCPACSVVTKPLINGCKMCGDTLIVRHWITGTLDGLLRSSKGELFILEHKTFSRHPDIHSLNMNDQFTAYMWIVRELFPDEVIGGIAYDGMWKKKSIPKGKKLSDLFLRLPIRKTNSELDEFGAMLADELNEMGRKDLPIYTNRRWEGCGDCGFERLCTAMSKGDDADEVRERFYTIRTDNKVRGIRPTDGEVTAFGPEILEGVK